MSKTSFAKSNMKIGRNSKRLLWLDLVQIWGGARDLAVAMLSNERAVLAASRPIMPLASVGSRCALNVAGRTIRWSRVITRSTSTPKGKRVRGAVEKTIFINIKTNTTFHAPFVAPKWQILYININKTKTKPTTSNAQNAVGDGVVSATAPMKMKTISKSSIFLAVLVEKQQSVAAAATFSWNFFSFWQHHYFCFFAQLSLVFIWLYMVLVGAPAKRCIKLSFLTPGVAVGQLHREIRYSPKRNRPVAQWSLFTSHWL